MTALLHHPLAVVRAVLATLLVRASGVGPLAGRRDERGDVPGWVLVTVMSAGLVGMLFRFAGPELQSMLRAALSSVSG